MVLLRSIHGGAFLIICDVITMGCFPICVLFAYDNFRRLQERRRRKKAFIWRFKAFYILVVYIYMDGVYTAIQGKYAANLKCFRRSCILDYYSISVNAMYMLLAMFCQIYIKSPIIARSHLWSKTDQSKILKSGAKITTDDRGEKITPKIYNSLPRVSAVFASSKIPKAIPYTCVDEEHSSLDHRGLTADRLTVLPTAMDALTICGKQKAKETKKCKTVLPTANHSIYIMSKTLPPLRLTLRTGLQEHQALSEHCRQLHQFVLTNSKTMSSFPSDHGDGKDATDRLDEV